ncbi:DNA topology modulation protein [Actinomadura alba]
MHHSSQRLQSTPMKRIAVVGCGGSGKSVLARALAEQTGYPITHLDAVYYDDDWNTLPMEKFAVLQQELVAEPTWVIDGNYASTLPIRLAAADTVVFLDLHPITCLWGIAQRRIRYRGGQHTNGVYDRVNWGFVKYVWGYRRSMAPRVRDLIAEHAGHAEVHVVKSRRAATKLAAVLGSST